MTGCVGACRVPGLLIQVKPEPQIEPGEAVRRICRRCFCWRRSQPRSTNRASRERPGRPKGAGLPPWSRRGAAPVAGGCGTVTPSVSRKAPPSTVIAYRTSPASASAASTGSRWPRSTMARIISTPSLPATWSAADPSLPVGPGPLALLERPDLAAQALAAPAPRRGRRRQDRPAGSSDVGPTAATASRPPAVSLCRWLLAVAGVTPASAASAPACKARPSPRASSIRHLAWLRTRALRSAPDPVGHVSCPAAPGTSLWSATYSDRTLPAPGRRDGVPGLARAVRLLTMAAGILTSPGVRGSLSGRTGGWAYGAAGA